MTFSSPPHPTTPAGGGEADAPPKTLVVELLAALTALRADYRSDGCSDPKCKICARSKAAEVQADAAIARAHNFLGGRPPSEGR